MKSISIGSAAAVLSLIAACVFDADDRCSEDQRYNEDTNICACPSGQFVTPQGCIECGSNERFIVESCQCNPGFERDGSGTCVAEMAAPDPVGGDAGTGDMLPNGEGLSCTSDADCAGTNATFCDTFFLSACIIENCEVGTNAGCNNGDECCDLGPAFDDRTICSSFGCAP